MIAKLLADPVGAGDVRTLAPTAAGLYAWWASPLVFPVLKGPAHPSTPFLRLLYIGLATKLRSRLASRHLGRSGSSTLRRTLAGFLLDDEKCRTRWTDRVVLVDDDERRRTEWMVDHMLVKWCEYATPRDVDQAFIQSPSATINVQHASGPARELAQAARRHYHARAGPRTTA